MIYTINDCPTNKEVWFAGIRYDNNVNWLGTDNIPKPVFNFYPIKGMFVDSGNTVKFCYDVLDNSYSIDLTYMDMLCYIFADTPEEAAQWYNNVIYKYRYKLKMMTRDLNFYRIKNTEGVY